jgi:transcriptional regulator with XRE-family HTH domain
VSIPEVLFNTFRFRLVPKSRAVLTSEQIRAARALLRWEQRELEAASLVSLPTIKRLESKPGVMAAHMTTLVALRKALETAGVEFIEENGGGPGVRLKKRSHKKV